MNAPDKIVYFVRHGQTEGNVTDIIQGLDDPLSATGELQAENLALRAQNLDFEVLISSDAFRAQQTAGIISKRTQHSIELSDLFREIKRPSAFIGKLRLTEEFQSFDERWRTEFGGEWRYGDEETVLEFTNRVAAAVAYLETRPESKILVVAHGYFLRALAVYLLGGKNFFPETYLTAHSALRGENTGLTVCRKEKDTWHILTWNDHAHLG